MAAPSRERPEATKQLSFRKPHQASGKFPIDLPEVIIKSKEGEAGFIHDLAIEYVPLRAQKKAVRYLEQELNLEAIH